eukprot:396151_1
MSKNAIPEPYAWSETFCIGHDETNTEHKNLFEKINALAADKANAEILTDLLAYVKLHFDNEEGRMEAKGYKELVGHKAVHEKFLADCAGVKEVSDETIVFLKQWLVDHILVSDMKYKGVL